MVICAPPFPIKMDEGSMEKDFNKKNHRKTKKNFEFEEKDGSPSQLNPSNSNSNNNNNNNNDNNDTGSNNIRLLQVPSPNFTPNYSDAAPKTPPSQSDRKISRSSSPKYQRPDTVHSMFDWYFDSSDEDEGLNEKSFSPQDLKNIFQNVLSNRNLSFVDERSTRAKSDSSVNNKNDHPAHQSSSRPMRADDNSCEDSMDVGAGPSSFTAGMGANKTFSREDDEEEQLQGHYEDVINVFKGVCFDLDQEKHLSRMFSMPSKHCLDDKSDPLKYYTNEPSIRGRLRRLFLRNSSTRLPLAFIDFTLRAAICLVYMVRVSLDDVRDYECYGSPCGTVGNSSVSERDQLFASTDINWYVLAWVHRSFSLWIVQVTFAAISLTKSLLVIYAMGKGHRMQLVWSFNFLLEIICSVPILATLCYPPKLINLFVPVFLNCWLARRALEFIYNDLHLTRQRFQNISVTLWQQMVLLLINMGCLVFTNVCIIQHIQRSSKETPLNMLDATYFVIVTFSTVGYGDISPDIWLSQLFMVLMICIAIAIIPKQIESIISVWMERKRSGGEYRSGGGNKHVIVCSSFLSQASVMDFLTEFYAHPKLEEHMVILLCSQDLDSAKQVILKDPKWSHRVIYMKGSSLNDSDLSRSQAQEAEACFLLAPRPCRDKAKADEHTILRSWAVKDFAPNCKQYIQLYSTENKIHVKFAEHVMCEDEFKYALLANNCLYPGLSTLVSLLVHTTSGQECMLASETWQQVYGRHSGNEIYHIQLKKSAFFSQYAGESFTAASSDVHHRFGVSLLAVLDSDSPSLHLQLNPGPKYILKPTDFCFYMSVTREEEYSNISPEVISPRRRNDTLAQIALALQKYHTEPENEPGDEGDESVFNTITSLMGSNITKLAKSITKEKDHGDENFNSSSPVGANSSCDAVDERSPLKEKGKEVQENGEEFEAGDENERLIKEMSAVERQDQELNADEEKLEKNLEDMDHRHGAGRVLQFYNDMGQEKLTIGPPPVTIYTGPRRATCHIMTEPRQLCCLEWGKHCDHCAYKNAKDERWQHQLIILAAEHPRNGIFNFIVPLRSSFIGVNGLCPIVLLLEENPDALFLDTMAQFPLVYWMTGNIHRVDDLLLAGINKASHLVVVNRDSATQAGGEDSLADSETIVAVQTIFKLFPNTNVITELSQASNMRFMRFSASHSHIQQASKRLEKKLKHTHLSSNFNHIYRLPFAAGQVFSASMLDTLLYQTFVKGYLISFVRLLLGIDAEDGSGHLSSIRVKRATIEKFPHFGELYEGLCSATGEIPFAIYRTERLPSSQVKTDSAPKIPQLKKMGSTISEHKFSHVSQLDQGALGGLVRQRLKSLDLRLDYSAFRKRPNSLSYVIMNPSSRMKLRIGDIIYVLQPSSMYAKPSRQKLYLRRSMSMPEAQPEKTEKESGPEKKVGRFKLRRLFSEKTKPVSRAEFGARVESETTTNV